MLISISFEARVVPSLICLAGYSEEDKLATVERRADLNGHLDYEKKSMDRRLTYTLGSPHGDRGDSLCIAVPRATLFLQKMIIYCNLTGYLWCL